MIIVLIKNKKQIIGKIIVALLIFGFVTPIVHAVIVEPPGGGSSCTRSCTKTSTKSSTKSSTRSSIKTATYNGYSVTLERSATEEATATGDATYTATKTRSTCSAAQNAACNYAQMMADHFAQIEADDAAQAAADDAAQAAADEAAQLAANAAAYDKWLWYAGPEYIEVEWQTVELISGNTYQFKVKVVEELYSYTLKLWFNDYDNQYNTIRHCDGSEYLYNYVNIEVQHNWYEYCYSGQILLRQRTEKFSHGEPGPPDRHLLLVHGWTGNSHGWDELVTYDPFMIYYGNNINAIDYYGDHAGCEPEFSDVTLYTQIETIGMNLKDYILANYQAGDVLDILAHSMGGLVTRACIKNHYQIIKDHGITIKHIGTAGTPNHGVVWASLLMALSVTWTGVIGGTQAIEMAAGSLFLNELNSGDETPYSADKGGPYDTIEWSTYAIANIENILSCTDGVVDTYSIPLSGASNHHYTILGGTNPGGLHADYMKQSCFYIMNDMFEELSDGASLPILPPLDYDWAETEFVEGTQCKFKCYINPEHTYDTKCVINGQNYNMEEYYIADVYQYHYFIMTLEEEKLYSYYFKGKDCDGYWYQSDKDIEIIADPLTISHQFFDDGYLFGTSTRTALDFAHYQYSDAMDATLHNFENDDCWVSSVRWNGALEFDGIDDYATIPNYMLPKGELTVSVLVNSSAVGNLGTLISYEVNGVEEFKICNVAYDFGDGVMTKVYIKGQMRLWDTCGYDWITGGWEHIAVVYSEKHTYAGLYVNGFPLHFNDDYWGQLTPGGTLKIGEGFEGMIDELFILNKYLNPDAIQNMYENYWGI
ncbi:MAG: LamG-like jellyroll fold domain-containing protein [Promethearchaeota archaeon]